LLGAIPASASADDYCVAPASNASCSQTFSDVQPALDAAGAASNPNRVILGAKRYVATNPNGFQYNHPGAPSS
jgi:hypothetical protein